MTDPKSYTGEDEIITSQQMKEIIDSIPEPEHGYNTGFTSLDAMTKGFLPQEMVLISGVSGEGKTSLIRTFLYRMANLERKSLLFTYEVPPKQFMSIYGKEVPFFTIPKNLTDNSYKWVEDKIIESRAKHNTDVVFIDHFYYLIPPEMLLKGNASIVIGTYARELKKMAVRQNVLIFIVAHLRKVEPGRKPEPTDIRDSQLLICESDFAMLTWRMKDTLTNVREKGYPYDKEFYKQALEGDTIHTNLMQLYLCKNRRPGGNLGYVMFEMSKLTGLFNEWVKGEGL